MSSNVSILHYDDLLARGITALSKRQIARLEAEGKFPRRVRTSERRYGWLLTEIESWLEHRVRERDAPRKAA